MSAGAVRLRQHAAGTPPPRPTSRSSRWRCPSLAPLVASGELIHRETVFDGIERAPAALVGPFDAQGPGRHVVALEVGR